MADGDIDEEKRATLRRFAALGTAAAVPTGITGTAAGSETDVREAMVGYLETTPGAHFSKLRDDLQLGTGETQYHLRELVEAEAITTRKDGDYRRYFPAGRFTEFEQVVLGYLRRETPRRMILELLETPGCTGTALARRVDVSRPTISKHASRLEEAGIINRTDGYQVTQPETIIVLLVRYADSFDTATAEFAETVPDLISHSPD